MLYFVVIYYILLYQQKQIGIAARNKLLRSYPRPILPKPLKDTNGLACRGVKDNTVKKFLNSHLPSFQSDQNDVLRIASSTLQRINDEILTLSYITENTFWKPDFKHFVCESDNTLLFHKIE